MRIESGRRATTPDPFGRVRFGRHNAPRWCCQGWRIPRTAPGQHRDSTVSPLRCVSHIRDGLTMRFRHGRLGRYGRYWARTSDPQLVDTRDTFAPRSRLFGIAANRRFRFVPFAATERERTLSGRIGRTDFQHFTFRSSYLAAS